MFLVWLLLIGLALFIVISVPIGFAIALSSLLVLLPDKIMSPWLLVQRMYSGLTSFPLVAIPLFLLAGLIMNSAGITDRLIRLSYTLVGSIKGGLAHVNIVVRHLSLQLPTNYFVVKFVIMHFIILKEIKNQLNRLSIILKICK